MEPKIKKIFEKHKELIKRPSPKHVEIVDGKITLVEDLAAYLVRKKDKLTI